MYIDENKNKTKIFSEVFNEDEKENPVDLALRRKPSPHEIYDHLVYRGTPKKVNKSFKIKKVNTNPKLDTVDAARMYG